jgi:REP element-mobilizing transposase RayT
MGMRKNRQLVPNGKHLVIARVNGGQNLFRFPDAAALFRKTVDDARKKYGFVLVDLEIVGNAVEMIVKTVEEEALPTIMRWILGVFAQRYNRANGRIGHFWGDRYISEILMDIVEKVFEAVGQFAYILRKIAKKSHERPAPAEPDFGPFTPSTA